MKKIFLVALLFLVISVFYCTATVKAMTDTEKQILINQIIVQIAVLQEQLRQQILIEQGTNSGLNQSNTWCHLFLTNMKYGDSGTEVGFLQQALAKQGLFASSNSEMISSFYGNQTVASVKLFQEKYRSEILTPNNLTSATGVTASATRAKLNQLYRCSSTVATSCTPAWSCSGLWGTCLNGQQTRVCYQTNCSSLASNKTEAQFCISNSSNNNNSNNNSNSGTCVPLWNYSNWGSCVNYSQTRTGYQTNCSLIQTTITENKYCDSSSNSNSSGNSQNSGTCVSSWDIEAWGTCQSGYKYRSVTDTNNCSPSSTNAPDSSMPCNGSAIDLKVNNSDGPITLAFGDTTPLKLTWSGSGDTAPTYCTASGDTGWSGTKIVPGSVYTSSFSGLLSLGSHTYTLTCITATQTLTDSVVINIAEPTITISANDTYGSVDVFSGNQVVLDWASSNFNSCTASSTASDWSGQKNAVGTETTPAVTSSRTYTITCIDKFGNSKSSSVAVNVKFNASIWANNSEGPITIAKNSDVLLTWSSIPGYCYGSGTYNAWFGSKASNGSQSYRLTTAGSYIFTITCGSYNDSVTVNVLDGPTVNLKINGSNGPVTVLNNSTANLTWTTANATSCTASGDWSGDKTATGTGSETTQRLISFKTNYTFTLTCYDSVGNSAISTVSATVQSTSVAMKVNGSVGTAVTDGREANFEFPVNTPITLSWTPVNASSCIASSSANDWSGSKTATTATSEQIGTLTGIATKTYTITCSDSGGNSTYYKVNIKPTTITATISASPTSVVYGSASKISWSSVNATSCIGSSSDNSWGGSKGTSGQEDVPMYKNTGTAYIFTIICKDSANNTATNSVTISVTNSPSVTISAVAVPGDTHAFDVTWVPANVQSCVASSSDYSWDGPKAILSTNTERVTIFGNYNRLTITCTATNGKTVSNYVDVNAVVY